MRTSSISKVLWIAAVAAGCVIAFGLAGSARGSAPQGSPIRFAIIGDYGWAGQPELDVANLVKSWNPEFIITVGDNNYTDGAASTIDPNIGQYYHEFIYPYTGAYGQGAPFNRFFPSLGNHDWETPGAQPYLDYFGLPGNERYYDFAQGPVRFFAVDSDPREPDGITVTSTQAIWLQNRLGATTETWKLVYFHHPPYSSGPHGGTNALRWPYRQWGADAVLAGHDHTYERIALDGFPYIINGLGGRGITDFGAPIPGSLVRYNADYGAMLADASDNSITFQFFSRAGALVDSYSITSTVATATSTPLTLDLVGNWEPYYYACDNLGFFLNVRTEPYNPSAIVPVTTTMYFNGATFVVPPFTGSYSRQCSGGPCSRSIVFNTLVVDYNNDVAETNEDNNVHSGTYFFGPMCTPVPTTTATATATATATRTATPTPTTMPGCCPELTGNVQTDCYVTKSGDPFFRGFVQISHSCDISVAATIQSFLHVSPDGSIWELRGKNMPRPITIPPGPTPYSIEQSFGSSNLPSQYIYYRITSHVRDDPCSANVFIFVSQVEPICRPAVTGTVSVTPSATATLTPKVTPTIGAPCGALPVRSETSCMAPSTYDYSFTFYNESGCQSNATGSATLYFEAAPSASGPFTTLDTQGRTVTFPPGPGQVTFTGTLTETNIPSQYAVYRISFSAASVRAGAYGQTQITSLCNTGGGTVTVTPGTTTGTPTQPTATRTSTVATPTSCALQFGDVPPYNTFYSYVRCLACRGIISGYNDGTFRPNNDITRGQIAKIVSQSAGFSDPAGSQIYEDVPPASPFYTWIQRLSNRALVGGYPCGLVPTEPCIASDNRPYFRPNASATRGQLSKIVASSKGINTNPTGQTYQDVGTTHTFYVWIEQLSNLGVMGGYPCGTVPTEPCGTTNKPYFRPSNNVTRGQASKIVANTFFPACHTPEASLCESIPPSVDMEITPDNCQAVGARFDFVGSGFQPGESITLYVTDPSGQVFGGAEQLTALPDGTTEPFAFQTQADYPTGRWTLTMQGESSGHEARGYFGLDSALGGT
jgi:tartrate-resistant acid phosphatase type 5